MRLNGKFRKYFGLIFIDILFLNVLDSFPVVPARIYLIEFKSNLNCIKCNI